jgi:hypothetical protein
MVWRFIFLFLFARLAYGQTATRAASPLAGCYEVTSLSWSPPDNTIKLIPSKFQLLNTSGAKGATFFDIHTADDGAGRDFPDRLSGWKPKGTKKIKIYWSTGFGGFRGTLKKAGKGDLVGKLKEWCDSHCEWKRRTGHLRLHRIPCAPN